MKVKIPKVAVRIGKFPRKFLHWASETSWREITVKAKTLKITLGNQYNKENAQSSSKETGAF